MTQEFVRNNRPEFQILFIVSNELELLKVTFPVTLDSLTKNSKINYEVIIQMDGANSKSVKELLNWTKRINIIDEVRIRDRNNKKLVCPGDPSNNPHFHFISNKSKYLIEIEGDVIAVLENENFDALKNIVDFFERHPEICLITSIIDYDCWVWKLNDVDRHIEKDIRSVNRVSSHFLIYHTERFLDFAKKAGIYDFSKYSDNYNYEDVISNNLVKLKIPIAFFDNWPVKVRHCDEKEYPGSLNYKRDKKLKLRIEKETIKMYSYKYNKK